LIEESIPLFQVPTYIARFSNEAEYREKLEALKSDFFKQFNSKPDIFGIGVLSLQNPEVVCFTYSAAGLGFLVVDKSQLFYKFNEKVSLKFDEGRIKPTLIKFFRISISIPPINNTKAQNFQINVIPNPLNYSKQFDKTKMVHDKIMKLLRVKNKNKITDKFTETRDNTSLYDSIKNDNEVNEEDIKSNKSIETSIVDLYSKDSQSFTSPFHSLSFSKIEEEVLKSEFGWNNSEITLAKKLSDDKWLKKQGKIGDKEISILWSQVQLLQGAKRVDFIIFLNDMILVLEVKGHNKMSSLPGINISPEKNAWKQCYEYVEEIKNQVADFINVFGIVVFPNLSASKYPELKNLMTEGEKKFNIDTWDKDILKDSSETIILALKDKILQNFSVYDYNPLKKKMLKSMKILIPKAFTPDKLPPNEGTLRINENNLQLHALEQEQIRWAHNLALTGDRIFYGIAGSGKTIILLYKALQIQELDTKNNVLILCYNKPLSKFLQQYANINRLEVKTFHSFISNQIRRWNDPLINAELEPLNQDEKRFSKMEEIIIRELVAGRPIKRYKYILIDEGQDFDKPWFEIIRNYYNEGGNSLFAVFLDSVQAIHKRKASGFRWIDVGINAQGRTQYLKKNYRNGDNIAKDAFDLVNYNVKSDGSVLSDVPKPIGFMRKGGKINYCKISKNQIKEKLIELINQKPKERSAMIVYCEYDLIDYEDLAQHLSINTNSIVINCQVEEKFATLDEIPIYSVRRVKGLEADIIYLLYSKKSKNDLLFVGITRARELVEKIMIKD
jgi:hypothetical protein